ncbi:hypothetical protein DPEC_G00139770 [Dallia pectoralis]|uniref:Uncharacterized protein n=1 Tax=Dallia pectoralis TaxID=75939 RepID=A0ACC2GM58_DALPE|nr:hypothetical protein DPEC_G00139770 [Dallia pectoralis]
MDHPLLTRALRKMSNSVYASRKRKKPQKSVKPPPEGAKSNPSKRHRERLNGELDRLASLLPYPPDVISKMDKLTILRLCVSYLRAKSFFNETLKSTSSHCSETNVLKKEGTELPVPEGELILQVLNGFVLVVTADCKIFYASSTIQEYLGFQQSDVIHQSVYDFIHTEDRAEFQRQLHWALDPTLPTDTGQLISASEGSPQAVIVYDPQALPPENSAFLERNFVSRFRCLHDSSSGFLALKFQGRLKFLHGQKHRTKEGKSIPPQPALFALASPLQPPTILEIHTRTCIFRTKHKLDFTPVACDAKGTMVLGYTEAELCDRGSGYQFIHAADMLYCAENHLRMIKTGESGLTVFRLLTKLSDWIWVQANARLVYKSGRAECIIASQRVITDEEGEENLKKRSLAFPFNFTTGEALLYDSHLPQAPVTAGPGRNNNNNSSLPGTLDPNSLLGSLLRQDESMYTCATANIQNKLPFQPPQEEVPGLAMEECGGIFSSSWQEGVLLSPSERVLFKQESVELRGCHGDGSSSKNSDWDLWSFMRNLGISQEDLLKHNDMFHDVDLGACQDGLLPDLTDDTLSYVHEFLWKRSDADQTPVPSGHQDPLHKSFILQPLSPQHHKPALPWQQQPVYAQYQAFPQQEQHLCDNLKHLQVNKAGGLTALSQPVNTKQQIPSSFLQQIPFHADLPGWLQTPHGQAQREHLWAWETSQDLPFKDQLNSVTVSTFQEPVFSCVPTGYFEGQEVGGEFTAPDLDHAVAQSQATSSSCGSSTGSTGDTQPGS